MAACAILVLINSMHTIEPVLARKMLISSYKFVWKA